MRTFINKLGYIYSRVLKKIRGVAIANSSIHDTSKVEAGSTIIDSSFNRHTFCGYDCTINNCDIGAFTSIASRVIIGGSMHPMHYVSMSPVFLSHTDSVKTKFSHHEFKHIPKTTIGSDVWIGEGVFIKSGVTIGHGAVIGMGSIVTKNIPDYSIFAGNPAKLIKMRFKPSLINELVKTEWWKLSDKKLSKYAKYFNNPTDFIEAYKAEK